MVIGKARIAKTRRTVQARCDAQWIDEFRCGEPPDPRDRRAIPIVYGSTRLASAGRPHPARSSRPASQHLLFETGVDDSAAAVALTSPTRTADRRTAVVNKSPVAVDAPPRASARETHPVRPQAVRIASTDPASSDDVTAPRASHPPVRFELRRFMFGIATGAVAAGILLAVLSMF